VGDEATVPRTIGKRVFANQRFEIFQLAPERYAAAD
jgi:hypothetical protein